MPNKENLDPEALQLCYLHSNWLYPKIIKRVRGGGVGGAGGGGR